MDGGKIIDLAFGLAIVLACVSLCSPYHVTVDGTKYEVDVGCGGWPPDAKDGNK